MSVTQSAALSTCPVYAWCRETGIHEIHNSEAVCLAEPGRTPHPRRYIEAWLMAENGRHGEKGVAPLIGFGDTDLTPDGLRAQIAEIRAILPRLEALANAAETAAL